MRIRDFDTNKYNWSLHRLNVVAYKYRMAEILEYDENEPHGCPDTAYVVVARNMEAMGLEHLLLWKQWWKIWKHHRQDLSIEQLTVVIYDAIAEFKQCYLDLMAPESESEKTLFANIKASLEKDRDFISLLTNHTGEIPDAFDYTITPEDQVKNGVKIDFVLGRSLLKEMGVTAIRTTEDVDAILWRIAFMGNDMERGFRNAMVELTNNNRMIDYIDFKCYQYNRQIGAQRSIRCNMEVEENKTKAKKARNDVIKLENGLSHKNKFINHLCNIIICQRERYLKVLFRTQAFAKDKNQALNFFILNLKKPKSKLCKAFDFNNEADMDDYIRLFKIAKRTIKPSLAKRIALLHIREENTRELFFNKVEEANNLIYKSRRSQ